MSTLPRCLILPFLVVYLAAVPLTAQEADIVVTPVGVAVVSESFPDEAFDFGPINGLTGTRVALLLKAGEGAIVGIEPFNSDIKSFEDSTGRDLLKAVEADDDGFGSPSGVDGFPRLSADNRQAVVEVVAPRSPAPDATSVTLRAQVAIETASGTTEAETGVIDLKPGKVTAEGRAFSIESLEVEDFGGGFGMQGDQDQRETLGEAEAQPEAARFETSDLMLTLKFTGDLATGFASLRLLDEAGQEIKAERRSSSRSSMSFGKTLEVSYAIDRDKLERANIELTVWEGFKQVKVPVDVTVNVGGFE